MKTADKILYHLKSRGPRTTGQLAEHFGVTTMGVRQHLNALTKAELISFYTESTGVGRPTRFWQLTDQGHRRFPDSHSDLTLQLIGSVRELFGESGLDQLIASREKNSLTQYQAVLSPTDDLPAKLEKLAALRSEEGYMAQWQAEGEHYLFIENHCPICAAATACQNFCQSELQQFQQLFSPQAEVERSEHIVEGARRCCYKITPVA